MNFSKIISGVAVLALIMGAIGFYLYTKPSELYSNGTPDFEIKLSNLLGDCNAMQDTVFNKKYVGKAVKFAENIEVAEITDQDHAKTFSLKTGNDELIVNASFDASLQDKLKDVAVGDKVQLQCECSGVQKPESDDDLISETVVSLTRCNLLNIKK